MIKRTSVGIESRDDIQRPGYFFVYHDSGSWVWAIGGGKIVS